MSRNIKMTVTAAVTMALLAPVIMLVDGCGAVSVGGSGVSVGMSMDAKEPGLLRKIDMVAETEMDKIPVEVHVSDYREQDGIKTSFKTVINVLGQERIFTTTSVEHNIEIPEGIFDLPEDIKALQK